MNVVLLVIDSLRACSLSERDGAPPVTPFMQRLNAETVWFNRAYASECWTLPSHCSLFTGLLPSQHGAHFQTMSYANPAPTIAELLSSAGYHTEVVTRNFIFDGAIPGITRGFRQNTRLLSDRRGPNPFALLIALAKPRVRRHINRTGFFHPFHKANRRFLATFARAMMPADGRTLEHTLERMHRHRRDGTRYFIFCNLYDVHAPYPPTPTSILRPFWSLSGCLENLMLPLTMASLGAHTYLRPDFHLPEWSRHMLLGRYHRAIELMDAMLADFYTAARGSGLLDDTLLVVTSDHGEAFGNHGLYLHDASVYNTHLHVPLWIHHPQYPPAVVNDVVSTRDLFGLIRAVTHRTDLSETLLGPNYRAEHCVALAEHFYYPHLDSIHPRYKQNIATAIAYSDKVILRRRGVERYDLRQDADEVAPASGSLADFEAACRRTGVSATATSAAIGHLRRWCDAQEYAHR